MQFHVVARVRSEAAKSCKLHINCATYALVFSQEMCTKTCSCDVQQEWPTVDATATFLGRRLEFGSSTKSKPNLDSDF